MFGEVRTSCVDDDTTGVATQAPFDDWHRCPIEQRLVGEFLIHPKQAVVCFVEEMRNAILVYQVFHPDSQFLRVSHLTGLIKHPYDEFLVIGCCDHGAIHVLLVFFQLCQTSITLVVELSHP